MGALFLLMILLLVIGIVYPASAVILYKLCGSRKSIAQIIREL